MDERKGSEGPIEERPEYEPPRVDQVTDAAEIEREVHYAGTAPVSGPAG